MDIPSHLLEILQKAERVAVLTGAGVSAESGVATFRDPDGLWAQFRPEELASMDGFLTNPERVWQWYQYRRTVIHSVQPNPGHHALAQLEKLYPEFTLITQNVDRLHQAAGSTKVLELHGNIVENYCSRCRTPYSQEIDTQAQEPPRCPHCRALIRPAVVWFGEMLPADVVEQAEEAAQRCHVFFTVGTSAEVYPAAALPYLAKRCGAYVVELNPSTTAFSPYADLCIHAPSGQSLPRIVELLKETIL